MQFLQERWEGNKWIGNVKKKDVGISCDLVVIILNRQARNVWVILIMMQEGFSLIFVKHVPQLFCELSLIVVVKPLYCLHAILCVCM